MKCISNNRASAKTRHGQMSACKHALLFWCANCVCLTRGLRSLSFCLFTRFAFTLSTLGVQYESDHNFTIEPTSTTSSSSPLSRARASVCLSKQASHYCTSSIHPARGSQQCVAPFFPSLRTETINKDIARLYLVHSGSCSHCRPLMCPK